MLSVLGNRNSFVYVILVISDEEEIDFIVCLYIDK